MITRGIIFLLLVATPAVAQHFDYAKCDAIARAIERKEKEWEWLRPYMDRDKKAAINYHRSRLAPRYCEKLFDKDDATFEKCKLQLIYPELPYLPSGTIDALTSGEESFYRDPFLLNLNKSKDDDILMMTEGHFTTLREMRQDYRAAKCP